MAKTPARSDQSDIKAFLDSVAQTPVRRGGGRGRLIFALDATMSRQPTWDRACRIQGEMFSETAALGGLDVQLVYYRGFGECRASRWVGDPKALLGLMTSVSCRAGHTQIGKILGHAIKETRKRKVDALVFIGDALEEQIDALGQKAGELGVLGVPVFAFQEGRDPVVRAAFEEVARLSGGAYSPFDSSSPDQLRDLLSAVAVYAAGGRQALLDFAHARGGEPVRLLTTQVSDRG